MRNEVSGTVTGLTLQAGAIHGDLYLQAPVTPRALVPRQLPPVPRHFTNRVADIAVLDGARETSQATLAVVSGPGGIGKTSLALRWLHRHADEFPDGQLYVDLRGHATAEPVAPDTVLPGFLRALGVQPTEVPTALNEQTALFRTVTAGLRLAVLCDNAMTAAQIRPLIPASAGSACVVTSRWRLTSLRLDGARMVPLEPLDTEAAVELLELIAGVDRIAGDHTGARQWARSCGLFPLSVCVGAALLASRPGWTVTTMATALAATLRSAVPSEEVSMTASLDQSYSQLPSEAARLYRRLGIHPEPEFAADVAEAIAVAAPEVVGVQAALDTLVEASLLSAPAPGRYRFHDLIHQHARDRAEADESDAVREECVARIVDYYLATANAADRVLYPQRRRPPAEYMHLPAEIAAFEDQAAALRWLDDERPNLMAVQRRAAEHGYDSATWQLADALWALFLYLKYHKDWVASHELGIAAAHACGNRLAEARLRNGLGVALREVERPEEAIEQFTRGMELRREIGDRRGEGLAQHNIGLTYQQSGRMERAADAFRMALTIREEADDARGIGREHAALGEVESLAGRHDEAIRHLQTALDLMVDSGDAYNQALVQRSLGEAYMRAGELIMAEGCYGRALTLLDRLGGVFEEGTTWEASARLAEREGRRDVARERYERANSVFTRLHAQQHAARVAREAARLGSAPGAV